MQLYEVSFSTVFLPDFWAWVLLDVKQKACAFGLRIVILPLGAVVIGPRGTGICWFGISMAPRSFR